MKVRAAVAAALSAGSLLLSGWGPVALGTASPEPLAAVPTTTSVTASAPDVVTSVVPPVQPPQTTPAARPPTTAQPPPVAAVVTPSAPVVRAPAPVPVPVPISTPRTTLPIPKPVPTPVRTVAPPVAPAAPIGNLGTAPIQKPPSGNFYKAGQFCPKVDANTTTEDASGRTLLCTDNNGLRWEPA